MAAGAGRARILIADGDPAVRRFVAALLMNHGYEVRIAADGESILADAASLKPDLLLMDVVLPGRDGFEVLNALRTAPAGSRPRVMILSVKDREEDVVKALDLGAEDYMIKPFGTQELLARVRKILERRG